MNRIIVIGCPGSGKSTFSCRLHQMTGIPLFHLDQIWWNPDRTHISREAFDRKLQEVFIQDRWIIDGNYSRTYEVRFRACDTVFFLDYSEDVCMDGIIGRIGKKRPDIPWTEQTLDPELVEMVQNYRTVNRPVILNLFEKYPEKRIIVFTDRKQADNWFVKNSENGRNAAEEV